MENALNSKTCVACHGGMPVLEPDAVAEMMGQLHGDWALVDKGRKLLRRVAVKGFNAAHHCSNVAAWLGEQEGHHPDIRFGWGYCEVEFTTHVVRGLTENDFICAAKFDRILAVA